MYITVLYSLLRIMDIIGATPEYWALIQSFGRISPEKYIASPKPSQLPRAGAFASASSKSVKRQG
jgi:hypothetical protein